MERYIKVKTGCDQNRITNCTNSIYKLYADGACTNNGSNNAKAGCGFVIMDNNDKVLYEGRKKLQGKVTNNISEYNSLILGLQKCIQFNYKHIHVYMDSKLVVEQVNGNWKVKKQHLQKYYDKCIKLIAELDKFQLSHVRREYNTHADRLSKEALLIV